MSGPTRHEILQRMKSLPLSLQKAIEVALGKEREEISLHTEAPATLKNSSRAVPTGRSPGSSWPGYIWFIETAPIVLIIELAGSPRYYGMPIGEREAIRKRLGWNVEDVARWRNFSLQDALEAAQMLRSSEETDRRGPGDTSAGSGVSSPR